MLWLEITPRLQDIYEAVGMSALVLLSQCLYYVRLKIHFSRGDLV